MSKWELIILIPQTDSSSIQPISENATIIQRTAETETLLLSSPLSLTPTWPAKSYQFSCRGIFWIIYHFPSLRLLFNTGHCSVFFYVMVSSVWSPEETQEKLRKKQCLLCSRVLKTGGTAHHMDHMGKTRGWSRDRRQGARGRLRPEPLLGFPWERQGRVNSLGWTSLSNFRGL